MLIYTTGQTVLGKAMHFKALNFLKCLNTIKVISQNTSLYEGEIQVHVIRAATNLKWFFEDAIHHIFYVPREQDM